MIAISKRLQRCLDAAELHARTRGHAWVGCEHVLLALLEDARGWPFELLTKLEILEEAKLRLAAILDDPAHRWRAPAAIGRGEERFIDGTATPRLRRCIGSAVERARARGHDGITSEHLLIAFAEDENGGCAALLDGLEVRREVIDATTALMSSDTYYAGECVIVDGQDRFLGLPVVRDGELWIKKSTGKLVMPGDL